MRLYIYLNENKKIPQTKKFGFFIDNPGGEWLEKEQKMAKGKNIGGAVTAGFKDPFLIRTVRLYTLQGLSGERRSLQSPRVQELMKQIQEEGIKEPIFINVNHNGEAFINEGNRRALIAKHLDLKWVPVEVRYFAGGEMEVDSWHPDTIIKNAREWKK